MQTTILIAIGVAYIILAELVRQRVSLPSYASLSYGVITLGTERGKQTLNWLAEDARSWRVWNTAGLLVGIPILLGISYLFLKSALHVLLVHPAPTPANNPQNALAIPGVNSYLPLSVAPEIILGLLLGMVIHEVGHGIACRVDGLSVNRLGMILFGFIPLGAFVEPNESELNAAPVLSRLRVYIAGVTNNIALALFCLALLFGPVTGAISVAAGVPVGGTIPTTPAAHTSLHHGDMITAVNGTHISTIRDLKHELSVTQSPVIPVTLRSGRTITVNRSVSITRQLSSAPSALHTGATIQSVNGTPVRTQTGFDRAAASHIFATLTTSTGQSATLPMGAAVTPTTGGALATAGAPTNTQIYIVRANGTRVLTPTQTWVALQGVSVGDSVPITAVVHGSVQTYSVTMQSAPKTAGKAWLGVTPTSGVSGMTVSDFGIHVYPSNSYLSLLSLGNGLSLIQQLLVFIVLPAASIAGLPYNFSGFTGGISHFYTSTGPLSVFGGGVFVLANILFWTAWVNLNLALFNLIPIYGLDGGLMMDAVFERVADYTGLPQRVAFAGTIGVSLLLVGGVLVAAFGPLVL